MVEGLRPRASFSFCLYFIFLDVFNPVRQRVTFEQLILERAHARVFA